MRKEEKAVIAAVIVVAAAMAGINGARAAAPSFLNLPTNFTLYEDQLFTYYVLAEDPEQQYPLNFSTTTDSAQRFPRFSITNYNQTAGLINFTPLNEDVGNGTDNKVQIVVADSVNDATLQTVLFEVINTNDPPNITDYRPSSLNPSITENDSVGFTFNYSASDDDLLLSPPQDNLTNAYYYDGSLITQNVTWTYLPGFCDAGYHNITLLVTDIANATDRVEWNVSVENNNRMPEFNKTIQNQTWQEDTNLSDAITLTEHFFDIDAIECTGSNKDTLTFTATGNSSIKIVINQTTGNVSFQPAKDFFGTETVYFIVSDGYNTTQSNPVTLTVTNVNDPPVIIPIGPQTAYEYATLAIKVNATDADNDALTFSDNSTLFTINTDGLINYTAAEGDAGAYVINISVTDGTESDSFLFNLTVVDNKPPRINNYSTQYLTENIAYQLIVEATDENNDTITFASNSSVFSISQYNSTAGIIQLTPTNDDVGNYSVLITATDEHGASNTTTLYFVVEDVNNPPVLDAIGSLDARVNNTLSKTITASDADNDYIYFGTNTTLFSLSQINSTAASFSFTPNASQIGNYSILFWANDTKLQDNETVLLVVKLNSPPVIENISNQTATEDSEFLLTITVLDADNDDIAFESNSTLFSITKINRSSARINFTPEWYDVGNYSIRINVSDGYKGFDSETFNLEVVPRNDPPQFSPPLQNMTAFENELFTAYIWGSDEEGDALNFSTNSSFFNLTQINASLAMINFTPKHGDIGNHSILFNVSDGQSTTTAVIVFRVRPTNNPPQILNYSPQSLNFTMRENDTMPFSVNATDLESDPISYYWYVDGVLNTTTGNFSYYPGFLGAGNRTVKVVLSDGFLNSSMQWNITVLNVNRAPLFGIRRHSTYSDFAAGTLNRTNATANGVVLAKNGTAYYANGVFVSKTMDVADDVYRNLTSLTWTAYEPSGTNVSFYVRTSDDSSSWSSWYALNESGEPFPGKDSQYVQYKAVLNTTNQNITPRIEKVELNFVISNLTMNEKDTRIWVDLDDYFTELDSDDNLTFNYTTNANILVSIEDGTHLVEIRSDHPDVAVIRFSAYDGNATTYSNNVTVTFLDVQEQTASGGGGGGGGGGSSSSITITKTKVINRTSNETQFLDLQIITPGLVTIYENETMEAPITLKNNENKTLENITLFAETELDSINMSFSEDYIALLLPREERNVTLSITSYKTYGSYEIQLIAKVRKPRYTDTATLYINSLEKGAENRTQLNTKIAFTQDLLEEHPECLELNELLSEAKKAVAEGKYQEAQQLIDEAVEGCKYIISASQGYLEIPLEKQGMLNTILNWFRDLYLSLKRLIQSFL